MNEQLISVLNNFMMLKLFVAVLVVATAVVLILRLNNIKRLTANKAMIANVENINRNRKRDKSIVRANKFLKRASNIGRIPLIKYDSITSDYIQYNLRRAVIKAPGGFRTITSTEFNGLCKIGITTACLIAVLPAVFGSVGVSIIAIIVSIILGNTLPTMLLRSKVAARDAELTAQFTDFYLMLHYVLLTGGKTPIDRVMKSYAHIAESQEIIDFIDDAVDKIDTHGELAAMPLIAKDYREVAVVGKMCRLIKQMLEGGDVHNELIGFRGELIQAKKWEIEKRTNKMVAMAQASFKVLWIILIQAVLSAMAIYLPDISSFGSLFG